MIGAAMGLSFRVANGRLISDEDDKGRTVREGKGRSLITLPNDYVVVDTETTGLDLRFDNIIEIAALEVIEGMPTEEFQTFVALGYEIPEFITDLTGITDEMLLGAPGIDEAASSFSEFIGDSIMLGHNANFDVNFLYDAFEANGMLFGNDFVDSMRVARKAFPGERHNRLKDVCERLGVTNTRAHRALADCYATNDAYQKMREILLERCGDEERYTSLFSSASHHSGKSKKAEDFVSESEPNPDSPLFGCSVVFTGSLDCMTRDEARQLVKNLGGIPDPSVTKDTDYLVIGDDGFSRKNQTMSSKMKKAYANQAKGLPIRVISEGVFLEMARGNEA
jgi:DNA polymerase-3 subunit epsilon